jgi:hypothetical protein
MWTWIVSNESLPYRVALGATILAFLATIDLIRNRSRATRWREYTFLIACTALAIMYGIVNDLITSRISVEYFLWGKGVFERVGETIAADPEAHRRRLDLEAIRIGAMATWSAGLIAGATLLFVNSLARKPARQPAWPMLTLARLVPLIFLGAIVMACIGGVVGASGGLTWMNRDFDDMLAADQWRPYRFMAVFGIHLGGYVGAVVGLIAACVIRVRSRTPDR